MIAVEDDPRPVRAPNRGERVDRCEHPAASEQHLADQDEIVIAARRGLEEPVGQALERFGRDLVERDRAVFRPARELAPGAMELAIGRQDLERTVPAPRRGRDQPDQEIVGVRRKDDGGGVAAAELARHMALRLGPDLVHHLVPLAVGETGGVVPGVGLPGEAGVGPQMMAVRREMQSVRVRGEAAREEWFEAHWGLKLKVRSLATTAPGTPVSRASRAGTAPRPIRRCRACCR